MGIIQAQVSANSYANQNTQIKHLLRAKQTSRSPDRLYFPAIGLILGWVPALVGQDKRMA